jgi:plasmid maintenance system antidote protein VapI
MSIRYRILTGPVRQFLRDRKVTQEDFAAQIDVNAQHFNRIVHGKTPLTFDMGARIASALGVELLAVMEPIEPDVEQEVSA